MTRFGRGLPEADAFRILDNPRRRATLRQLGSDGTTTLSELATAVAAAETGHSPAPRRVRDSVYASLKQTHLPLLAEQGILEYDVTTGEIRRLDRAREVDRYMNLHTPLGVTWGGYYRGLGVAGLFLTVVALANLAPVASVDPLLWASGTLGLFSLSTLYQLWCGR
jgi:hypothetical protein